MLAEMLVRKCELTTCRVDALSPNTRSILTPAPITVPHDLELVNCSSTENWQILLTRLKKMHSRRGVLPRHKPMPLLEIQTGELKFDFDNQEWAERLLAAENRLRDCRLILQFPRLDCGKS